MLEMINDIWRIFASFFKSLRLLDEEEATDNDLRAKFKERWQRTASNDLYKPLRAGNYGTDELHANRFPLYPHVFLN